MPQLQADRVLRELKQVEPLSVRRAGGYRAFASGYGLATLGGGAEMLWLGVPCGRAALQLGCLPMALMFQRGAYAVLSSGARVDALRQVPWVPS